jgi:hypothetical protein
VGTFARPRQLVDLCGAAGLLPGRGDYYWEAAGGDHNEDAWAARFDKVLLYFFGLPADGPHTL